MRRSGSLKMRDNKRGDKMKQSILHHQKKCLKRILIFAVILFLGSSFYSFRSYASSIVGIEDQLDGMSGDAKYAGSEYRDNYRLDTEHLGLTEAGSKMMAEFSNGIWLFIYWIAFLGIALFYRAMSLDFAKLLSDQIQTIQEALHESMFQPLFMIAVIGTFAIIVVKYARRDFTGLIGEFGKIFFIMILSVWLVRDSSSLLSGATNITKGLSITVLTEMSRVDVGGETGNIQLGDGTELYAQQASGVLWSNLIHQSWKFLEFGNYKPSDEMVDKFLSTSNTEEREALVKEVMQDHPEVFSKDRIAMRIGQGLIMGILIFIKTIIYVLLGVLQIVLQVIAIVFVLFAPIILFLALIPSYGFDVLGIWAKKIFETQLAVLLITFLMGFMIMISNLINSISNSVGWLVGLLLEVILGIGLFYYRSQVFSMFAAAGQMGRVVSHPAMLKHAMKYGVDPFQLPYPGYGGDGPFFMGNRRRSPQYYQDDEYGPEEDTEDPGETEPTFAPRQTTTRSAEGGVSPSPQVGGQEESGSYYASYEVSDNWREQWYGAKRPTTEDRKSNMERAPIRKEKESLPESVPETENDNHSSADDIATDPDERAQKMSRPVTVPESRELDRSGGNEEQDSENFNSTRLKRPVTTGEELSKEESRGQRFMNEPENEMETMESSNKEIRRERPRTEAKQLSEENPGHSMENVLETAESSPEENRIERPRTEAGQLPEEQNLSQRYENNPENEVESIESSPEENRIDRPRTVAGQLPEEQSLSQGYENSPEHDMRPIEHSHNGERPMTRDQPLQEDKNGFQMTQIGSQDVEKGLDEETANRNTERPETQSAGSQKEFDEEIEPNDIFLPEQENAKDRVRPMSAEEHSIKQTETATESNSYASDEENTVKGESGHTRPNVEPKRERNKIASDGKKGKVFRKREIPRKQVKAIHDEEEREE